MSSTPIIAGFYADPSICRAGDTCVIVNSSFEFMPGVPLHRSIDLTTWLPVTNVLSRQSQLDVTIAPPSTGVYATTVRFHAGRFYMITTNVVDYFRGQLMVSATAPEGPWSEPVHVPEALGIDPDLCWDEDGTCRITWASSDPALPGIFSAPLDPATGALLGPRLQLWQGTGLAFPEGPHLYRRNGWWYLLLAEGGTERGHAVTIARTRALGDEFEPAPGNPILTHRSTSDPVQNTGHADLVELADGTWAMVYLGVRPHGQTPMYHVNGRETFLAGIDWVDDWPVVDETRFEPTPPDHGFEDSFASDVLDMRWVAPNIPPSHFTAMHRDRGLRLTAAPANRGAGRPMLLARARDREWRASAMLETDEAARFLVRIDDRHWYGLQIDSDSIEAVISIGPATATLARQPHGPRQPIRLVITCRAPQPTPPVPRNEADIIELGIQREDGHVDVLASLDGRYLSTEVAGGFTGRTFGVEPVQGETTLHHIDYKPLALDAQV